MMESAVNKRAVYSGTLWSCIAALILLVVPPPATGGEDGHGAAAHAKRDIRRGKRHIAFEVAENGSRFTFDEAPIDANGFPLYGNPFITQGFIYPAGTLDPNDPARDGVIPVRDAAGNVVDAKPEFPDLLLGIWVCYGTVFAQEGFNITSGATVISTQLYDFEGISGKLGKISLTSNGLELIDLNVPVHRAIIGGTGPFRKARGQVKQTFFGVNESEGFMLRFEADVR